MSTVITFLSGKGGSGKTTLAISMADLMRRCGVRTLLIDCDLSTNGATYFYEEKLLGWNENEIRSFYDVLRENNRSCVPTTIVLDPKLDFVPSLAGMSDQYLKKAVTIGYFSAQRIEDFLYWARQNYEVILLDCQAGYTELLPRLLPFSDIDLFVLEADGISGSAMRSLYLKIGERLKGAKLYQVFNKATPEEFDIYSKIVGTFFTNIGTLLFDWRIRQAFSRSQVPDLETTSASFGEELCDICEIMFKENEIQEKLNEFRDNLVYQKLEEEYRATEDAMYSLMDRAPVNHKWFLGAIPLFSVLMVICIWYFGFRELQFKDQTVLIVLALSIASMAYLMIKQGIDALEEVRENRRKNERKLRDIEKMMNKIESKQKNQTVDL